MPQLPQTPPLAALAALETLDGYRRLFADPVFWHPYVREVGRKHNLLPCDRVRMGIPGTYPTFIMDERWVVKFFGRLFEGEQAFQAEYQANHILPLVKIKAPGLILQGFLNEEETGWRWPYLVFEYLSAVSIGEVYEQVSFVDKLALARDLGHMTRRLHSLPLDQLNLPGPVQAFQPNWNAFLELLRQSYRLCFQTQTSAGVLPSHLLEQIQEFLLAPEELVDLNQPAHLIHADLTRDHLLGGMVDNHWQTQGIIDWGDAMTGNYLYELLALHLDLFHADKRLLQEYLEAYGLDKAARRKLPRQAMCLALMHRFNVLVPTFRDFPALRGCGSIEELADTLWNIL